MHTTDKNWVHANRRYLIAFLRIVQEELTFFIKNRKKRNWSTSKRFTVSAKAQQELKSAEEALTSPAALDALSKALNLSSFEQKMLLMCTGVELIEEFCILDTSTKGQSEIVNPSFNLAMAAFSDAHWSALAPASPLLYWGLVHIRNGSVIAKSPLTIDEQILHYLTGFSALSGPLDEVLTLMGPAPSLVPSQQRFVVNILNAYRANITEPYPPFIELNGDEQGDQIFAASAIASDLKRQLYRLAALSIPQNQQDRTHLVRLWNREELLHSSALMVDCSGLDLHDKTWMSAVTIFLESIRGLVILINGDWTSRLNRSVLSFEIEKPNYAEQLLLWEEYLGKAAKFGEDSVKNTAAHFNLSTRTLSAVAQEVVRLHPPSNWPCKSFAAELEKALWITCCKFTRPQVDDLVQEITPVATWDDIVLPEDQETTLKEIAMQVKYRHKVYNEWGFADTSSRGFGISVLFSGESGTGKTMASEVLANELQLPLFRIDLSQVINKYIGETEKNLKRIFDAAEEGGAILLFDEAEALFSKRTDVKDSHDRYGNQEVSYLLQRMESYRGLAILTTNMKSSLEPAIMRRIRFVCHFSRPDASLRTKIWKGIFPKHTPRHPDLDIEKLSKLNVSGGNIRNIAMNAAFLAASEDRTVEMGDILRATRSEYQKLDKTLTRNELKDWQ